MGGQISTLTKDQVVARLLECIDFEMDGRKADKRAAARRCAAWLEENGVQFKASASAEGRAE